MNRMINRLGKTRSPGKQRQKTQTCNMHYRCISKKCNILIKSTKSNFFQKVKSFFYFKFITCKVKHLKRFFIFLFWWLELAANESQKSLSQNITILEQISCHLFVCFCFDGTWISYSICTPCLLLHFRSWTVGNAGGTECETVKVKVS